ncbi:hypothetical protein P4U05_21140 [Bacillus paranthracis]|nr:MULTISPECIES: hypothetical protein [Bacillus]ADY24742.1 hypothetical protein YBT020_27929 [Bacillus thuringiensis serovar finitimus YBT-020]KYQ03770.1 hypothetical protein B4079_1052 [Bacillus cereus]MDU2394430.1 hypothetical protein [Bacillus sp. (in: firmicutes)]MEC3361119.1 hypothetical protein [Bacillus paranthracis]MED0787368.1 hypothetical protein [Bacillus paranthracis]
MINTVLFVFLLVLLLFFGKAKQDTTEGKQFTKEEMMQFAVYI